MEQKVIKVTQNICDEIIEEEKECFYFYRYCKKKIIKFIKCVKSKLAFY